MFGLTHMEKPFTPPDKPLPTTVSTQAPRVIDSQTLLGPDGQAIICHHGNYYQLRQTQAGKLILTK